MGRMIDADRLIAELKESAFHHCNNSREDSLLQRDRVIVRAQPTVEAIPKDQYEARLKADMVAMLTELQTEVEKIVKEEELIDKKWANGLHYSEKIIQQKIDKLKENMG